MLLGRKKWKGGPLGGERVLGGCHLRGFRTESLVVPLFCSCWALREGVRILGGLDLTELRTKQARRAGSKGRHEKRTL